MRTIIGEIRDAVLAWRDAHTTETSGLRRVCLSPKDFSDMAREMRMPAEEIRIEQHPWLSCVGCRVAGMAVGHVTFEVREDPGLESAVLRVESFDPDERPLRWKCTRMIAERVAERQRCDEEERRIARMTTTDTTQQTEAWESWKGKVVARSQDNHAEHVRAHAQLRADMAEDLRKSREDTAHVPAMRLSDLPHQCSQAITEDDARRLATEQRLTEIKAALNDLYRSSPGLTVTAQLPPAINIHQPLPAEGTEWIDPGSGNVWVFYTGPGWTVRQMGQQRGVSAVEPNPPPAIEIACSCGKNLDERDTTKDGAITCYWCGAKHRVKR
jgi:hypothetical protein